MIGPTVPHAYPLMLDLAGKTVLIVGGGPVAARKAAGVLAAGGAARAVAPAFAADFPAAVERRAKRYDPADLDDIDLAFAATDSAAVNDAVVADARARRVWAGHAGDAAEGDISTPPQFAVGPVVVTVSAGSAALGVRLRDELRERFDPLWAEMAQVMVDLRPAIRDGGLDSVRRRDVFRDLATDDAFAALQAGGLPGLRRWLDDRHPDLAAPLIPHPSSLIPS